jgi:hypothetical protein
MPKEISSYLDAIKKEDAAVQQMASLVNSEGKHPALNVSKKLKLAQLRKDWQTPFQPCITNSIA